MRKRWILAVFVLLLAASTVVRLSRSAEPEPGPDARETLVPEVRGDGRLERRIRLVWSDSEPGPGLPVVLLHGSPGRRRDLARVAGGLRPEHRTILPDLPGFGDSEHDVADYSIRAHAHYVLELLDQLGVERFHVVGFSLGGGVALNLADLAPERVASLVMVSAIGVQELELFGDYHLNHAVHGLQLGGLWAIQNLLPHFGWLDDSMLSVAYARNFYDTDQRPLRGILSAWRGPCLILHGEDDPLVPVAAAREHARLVPQSELVIRPDGSHFMVFTRGPELAETFGGFFERVESGRATTRATASPDRLAAAAEPFDPRDVPPFAGIGLVLFLCLAAAATLVSEDLTCVAVGATVAEGRVGLVPGVLACFVGIYVGDLCLFLAGRWVGRRALGKAPWRWFLTESRVVRSSEWFERRGPVVIFLSRFMPGLRLPTYFASGLLRTSFLRFSLWFALAALAWTPLVVWLSSQIGGTLSTRVEVLRQNLLLSVLTTIVVAFLVVKLVFPLASHRGRRLLLSSWKRLVRWEYWPMWAFYPPIVLACAWYGLRRRSLLAFTAVNPAIPHGGFVGESKRAILEGLSGSPGRLARTVFLPAGEPAAERLARALRFREENALAWPLVVKPDAGQRGEGVHVVRSAAELERHLDSRTDLLVQEFLEGREYGLFYARHPGERTGRILSITSKELPFVTGDGERTLEELILDDARAVRMARFFLDENAARLGAVPAAGERVPIGELGTHCRGATFRDGAGLLTPELEAALDEVARGFDGFYFGRFDVRSATEEDLRAGRFRILELNGVTSEAAHVYDERYSVLDGWRTIASQWRMAYDIGAENMARGARASRPGELLRELIAERRRARERRSPGAAAEAAA